MNKTLGDAMVVVMLLLGFLMVTMYITLSDPAGSPMFNLIVKGTAGVSLLFTITLIGMVIKDTGPSNY
ncbi:hypothetical protein [Natrinema salsiterrestre]|uniref:Uncharacterized protein n=1 Tax=Natrinema salsiterrestre TaxID=2950540 RepID=A0A9Q4Q1V0_9EURY|nr:hypothetical protein [Natrinema salsiterrestre]MDF9748455.1 hypothetical protein [Natrinema salsiterrestre]